MTTGYRIDKEKRAIFTTLSDVLTDADLLQHQTQLQADPHYDGRFVQLVDARDVTEVDVTKDGVHALASLVVYEPGARRAIVATRDAMYGMARMFERLRGGRPDELRVFRDIDEARRWLGLD